MAKTRRRRRPRLNVGSLSEGTLRTEDIWDALHWELCQVAPKRAAELQREWDALVEGDEGDEGDELLGELYEALEEYVPPYCYLGSHEGDGASIGIWVSWDALDEAQRDGEVWREPEDKDNESSACPRSARYRLVVSDHGNATLYHRNGREIWGVV